MPEWGCAGRSGDCGLVWRSQWGDATAGFGATGRRPSASRSSAASNTSRYDLQRSRSGSLRVGCRYAAVAGGLQAAVAAIIRLATANGCRSITVEDLDFADVRQGGRETLGAGDRGKRFRHTVTDIPTRQFRDLLVGMTANAGLWVVAVDPGWTSKWGRRYWQHPLTQSTKATTAVTGHHAAAVVIGRRGLGLGARRRPGVTRPHRRMGKGELPDGAWRPGGTGPFGVTRQRCQTLTHEERFGSPHAGQSPVTAPGPPLLLHAPPALRPPRC
jgi:hypothetical protein